MQRARRSPIGRVEGAQSFSHRQSTNRLARNRDRSSRRLHRRNNFVAPSPAQARGVALSADRSSAECTISWKTMPDRQSHLSSLQDRSEQRVDAPHHRALLQSAQTESSNPPAPLSPQRQEK